MVLALGALFADVPHSRPVQLIGTANDQEMIDRFDLQRSRYEGPTGIVGVVQDACNKADLLTASLWAAVPAYASQIASPKASLALLERLGSMLGVEMPTEAFAQQCRRLRANVDASWPLTMISGYVQRLEGLVDAGMDSFDDDLEMITTMMMMMTMT